MRYRTVEELEKGIEFLENKRKLERDFRKMIRLYKGPIEGENLLPNLGAEITRLKVRLRGKRDEAQRDGNRTTESL